MCIRDRLFYGWRCTICKKTRNIFCRLQSVSTYYWWIPRWIISPLTFFSASPSYESVEATNQENEEDDKDDEVCGRAQETKSVSKDDRDVRRFECDVCSKRFLRNEYLRNHMRIHSGERLFSCSLCDAAFRTSGNLRRHERIHTGEKRFSCNICGAAFTERGLSLIHIWCCRRYSLCRSRWSPYH